MEVLVTQGAVDGFVPVLQLGETHG